MAILVVTDNPSLVRQFVSIYTKKGYDADVLDIRYSHNNSHFDSSGLERYSPKPINLKMEFEDLLAMYDLIFSIHCKQIFPKVLVENVRCINVHPGLNPHNRGWYPQVFSIINGLPLGATIHEMDESIDHGSILAQMEVKIEKWDTSISAYEKVLSAEVQLLETHLEEIISGELKSQSPLIEGNYNSIRDFERICRLDLSNSDSLQNHLNLLRALSHGEFKNAYFTDLESGRRIFVKIDLIPDDIH